MTFKAVYLDHQSTTPVDPHVMAAMLPYFSEYFANPHSISHSLGREANDAVANARKLVAKAIGADAREVFFTSGATEANNIAIQGVARATSSKRRKIITLSTEHSSVLEPVRYLSRHGFESVILPVMANGLVDLNRFEEAVSYDTLLVSVMHVNNETGVIHTISDIANLCHEYGALFHSDCAQALGKLSVNVQKINADLITFSAHKVYGPKGIGVLYIRRRPRVPIEPLFFGGEQESGIRPGTLPVPLCVGFGKACYIAHEVLMSDVSRIDRLTERFVKEIQEACPDAQINARDSPRASGIVNFRFPNGSGTDLLHLFEGVQISLGSACSSVSWQPSHVLKSMGLSNDAVDRSLRFGFGRFTTDTDVTHAINAVTRGIRAI